MNQLQSNEKIDRRFKVKEIKRLTEENKKTNVKIVVNVGLMTLATISWFYCF